MAWTWIDPKDIIVPDSLKEAIGGHPLVTETLVRRGINNPAAARAFLDPAHYSPTPAYELPGIDKATIRIRKAIEQGETILIWGDFDVDGQTSTTLLVEALRELGASIEFHIPVRETEGHGIQVDVLEKIINKNPATKLLLTCDTGIAANEAIAFANTNGLHVIITDHHDLPENLPQAYAIVNPKTLSSNHPLASLPGVGVAFKLVEALFDHMSLTTKRELAIEKYLDLVALGTVADVAEQYGDTRYLLQVGLNMLRNTKRSGLQTLMELAQIVPSQLDEGHIGFSIAPRLNALGRLSDANPIVEFLTTDDPRRARVLATQLEGLNERRKLLTEQITQAALAQIAQDHSLPDQAALVLAHTGWHTGVIGIVASRLVERFGKPTILLSIGCDGIARGSARSVDGIHITEAIATQKALLNSFGGHPGAAGLSLPAEDIPQFRRGLGRAVRTQLGDQSPEPAIQIDAYLPFADLSLELANEIRQLAPFGAGNPPLVLASHNLTLVSHTTIGPRKDHLRLVVTDDTGNHQNVLWWNGNGNPLPDTESTFSLAYTLQASTFRGERQLQIQWLDFHSTMIVQPKTRYEYESLDIVDLRDEARPAEVLKSIQSTHNIQIWAEGEAKSKLGGLDRNELSPGKQLAVWTTPPGPLEWKNTLERVNPEKLYLFAVDPQMDDLRVFLERLGGLVKFALRAKNGKVCLEKLAAATCQQEKTVRMGLLWLEAKGLVQVLQRSETVIWLAAGSRVERSDSTEIGTELTHMLAETAAYRAHYKTTQNNLT